MTVGNLVPRLKQWVLQATDALRAAGRWWVAELLATLPSGLANWLVEGGARSLVVAPGDGTVALHLLSDRRRLLTSASINQADYAPDLIDGFLQSSGMERKGVALGIRMPTSSIFFRSLLLPIEVRRALDAVVVQDMVAKTPFQLDDVYQGHAVSGLGDAIGVRQWIVRRKHVAAAADALGIDADDLAFVEPQQEDDGKEPLPVVALRDTASTQQRWIYRTSIALVLTACLLTCVAAGLRYAHQQRLLDSLEIDIATARSKAQQTLAKMKELQRDAAGLDRVRLKRSAEPGLLDIWEETTRLLPSHTWVTELRLSETPQTRQVVMTGLSRAAAALVPLVDRSAMFSEASLVAPISLDQTEERERFAIQASVRSPGKSWTALK